MVRWKCYWACLACDYCKFEAKTEYECRWVDRHHAGEDAHVISGKKMQHHVYKHHTCRWCGKYKLPAGIARWKTSLQQHMMACPKNPEVIKERHKLSRNLESLKFLAIRAELPDDILRRLGSCIEDG